MKTIKSYLPPFIRDILSNLYSSVEISRWKKNGRPLPLPNKLKQEVVKDYARKYNTDVLVETGTYLGSMIYAQRKNFSRIVSIELSEELYKNATNRFRKYQHISIVYGDSAQVLGGIVESIHQPALFWLDGHYSGGITAESVCPVPEELRTIMKSQEKHVILIDDARCFKGEDDYPSVEEIKKLLNSYNRPFELEVKDDIIRVTFD